MVIVDFDSLLYYWKDKLNHPLKNKTESGKKMDMWF